MRRWRRCARRALGRGRAARSLRHGTRADPVRGFATGAKPATGGESVDSPSSASADAGRRAPGREGACRAAWPAVTRTPRSLRHGTRVDVVEELAVGVKPTTEGESAATRHDGHSYTRTGPSTGLLTGNAPLPMCPDKTVTHVPGLDPPPSSKSGMCPPPASYLRATGSRHRRAIPKGKTQYFRKSSTNPSCSHSSTSRLCRSASSSRSCQRKDLSVRNLPRAPIAASCALPPPVKAPTLGSAAPAASPSRSRAESSPRRNPGAPATWSSRRHTTCRIQRPTSPAPGGA